MAAWQCTACTAVYSVGAPQCPQCGATDHVEEGQPMPKITVHGGVSNEADDEHGEGDLPSLGKSSPTSTGKPSRSQRTSKPADPSPAPTTESPSPKARTGSSTASSTAGGRTARSSD